MVQLDTPLFQFEAKPQPSQPPPPQQQQQQQHQQQQDPYTHQQSWSSTGQGTGDSYAVQSASASTLGLRERRRAAGNMMSQQLLEEETDVAKHATQRMNFAQGVEKEIAKVTGSHVRWPLLPHMKMFPLSHSRGYNICTVPHND